MTTKEEGSIFLVNKPVRWTSFDVVARMRRILKMKKIGHAGTLDPLASGLLIICTGKMTKSIESFQGLGKEYTGKFTLGQTTASYDLETETSPAVDISNVTDEQILAVAKTFVGNIQQIPPIHSSIWVNGRRAYKFARQGQEVVLQPREVEIKEFEITKIEKPEVSFRIVCSKGTYIRSLANDLGSALGVGAHLSELTRTAVGEYKLKDAETLEAIKARIVGPGSINQPQIIE
ncbi:MAG: tRNA pseudouridine(55) synthase TruB [Cyclobacteriaceae bacterium]|nr:tRNA pseudouridine(55) synthase TruB [Cyclobacteriaceae bacterium]